MFLRYSLSDWGSLASVISFFISLYTLFTLIRIKKKFLFRSKIEQYEQNVQDYAKKISLLLQSYEKNKTEIDELVLTVDVVLRDMAKGTDSDLCKDVKVARNLIKKYRKNNNKTSVREIKTALTVNETSVREIKTALTVIVAQLNQVRQNYVIGGN